MNASVSPLGTARSSVTGFTDVMLKLTTPISPTPSTGSPVATGANNRKLRQQKELLAQQRLKEERESPFTVKHAKLLQKVNLHSTCIYTTYITLFSECRVTIE